MVDGYHEYIILKHHLKASVPLRDQAGGDMHHLSCFRTKVHVEFQTAEFDSMDCIPESKPRVSDRLWSGSSPTAHVDGSTLPATPIVFTIAHQPGKRRLLPSLGIRTSPQTAGGTQNSCGFHQGRVLCCRWRL
jgi:hypothetical protein